MHDGDEFQRTIIVEADEPPETPEKAGLQLIVVADGVALDLSFPVGINEISIGRFTGSSLVIDHHTLSRFHAVLRPGPPTTIEDLGSANGTFVREVRIQPGKHVPVTPGDVVRLGSVILILRAS